MEAMMLVDDSSTYREIKSIPTNELMQFDECRLYRVGHVS